MCSLTRMFRSCRKCSIVSTFSTTRVSRRRAFCSAVAFSTKAIRPANQVDPKSVPRSSFSSFWFSFLRFVICCLTSSMSYKRSDGHQHLISERLTDSFLCISVNIRFFSWCIRSCSATIERRRERSELSSSSRTAIVSLALLSSYIKIVRFPSHPKNDYSRFVHWPLPL